MLHLFALLLIIQTLVLAEHLGEDNGDGYGYNKDVRGEAFYTEFIYDRRGPNPRFDHFLEGYEVYHHKDPRTQGSWSPLDHQPTFLSSSYPGSPAYPGGVHNPKLLTDGSVLVHNVGEWITREIWKLTPDRYGSYLKGNWSKLAPLPEGYAPLWYGSAVLADGRVVFLGGQYDGWLGNPVGAVYDPVRDEWTPLPAPDFFVGAGDCATVVLEDGTLLVQDAQSDISALLDPKTLKWTKTGKKKQDANYNERWVLLPDGKVLTVDSSNQPFVHVAITTNQHGVGPFDGIASVSSVVNKIHPLTGHGVVPEPTVCSSDLRDMHGKIAVFQKDCSENTALKNVENAGAIGGILISDIGPAEQVEGDMDSFIYLCSMNSKDGAKLKSAIHHFPHLKISIKQQKVHRKPMNSEIFDPKNGIWSSAGSTRVALPDPEFFKQGPLILRPDGTVVAFGGHNGNTSIFDTHKKKWKPGPNFPVDPKLGQIGMPDGSAVLLPNGNILVSATAGFNYKTFIFEFDGKKFKPQPVFPNGYGEPGSNIEMMLLPTGQVMAVDLTNDVEIFTPLDRSFKKKWRPVIYEAPKEVSVGKTYRIEGIRFNGMSQAANYPLVRITNKKTKHVFYCRTHHHSFMGVASEEIVSTHFDVLKAEKGESILEVVANGIPSEPLPIKVHLSHKKKHHHHHHYQ